MKILLIICMLALVLIIREVIQAPYVRDLGIPDDREDEPKKDNENK